MDMKTYCKPAQVNIEDLEFIKTPVHLCFAGKLRKRPFQRLLISTGKITREQLLDDLEKQDMNRIIPAIDAVAEMMHGRIMARDLQLSPVRQFQRVDGTNGKLRDLCQEGPEQQICEYIAKYALDPLFRAKILPFQHGSIPGRGQNGALRHNRKVMRKMQDLPASVQCDIRKAYPSTTVKTVMKLLSRDVGKNKPLLWFVEAIMENYPHGVLLIGGYLSCWIFNYVMSYVLRHLLGQAKARRGKRLPMVRTVTNYADDFVCFGHLSNLVRALKVTVRWAKKELGLQIKDAWMVNHLASKDEEEQNRKARLNGSHRRTPGVDMVGYVVRRTYTIVRGRSFVRYRRQFIRANDNLNKLGYIPWWRAQKIIAEWGWIKNADSRKFCRKYNAYAIVRAAKLSVSWHARRLNYGKLYPQTFAC